MKKEIWKDITGWEGYYKASSFGRIKSLKRIIGNTPIKECVLSATPRKDKYIRISLYKETVERTMYAHRLVCMAFHENKFKKPNVNHKDGDKSNNCSDNLEWATRKENAEHAKNVLGVQVMGTKHYMSKFTDADVLAIKSMRERGIKLKEISKIYNVHLSTIGKIVTGVNWKQIKTA